MVSTTEACGLQRSNSKYSGTKGDRHHTVSKGRISLENQLVCVTGKPSERENTLLGWGDGAEKGAIGR